MSTDNAIAAVERVDVERTVYNWAIPEFKCKFQELDQRKHLAHSSRRKNGNVKEKLPPDSSNLELISGTFVRGQFVQRTSLWFVLIFGKLSLHLSHKFHNARFV